MATSLAVIVAALGTPVLAADWSDEQWAPDDIRGGYSNEPKDWSGFGDEGDGLHFETGLRYWYSMGSQGFDSAATADDTAHILEGSLRIDDDVSATFAKANVGYSVAIQGNYDDGLFSGDVGDGAVGYAGADFGWNAFNDGQGNGIGGLIGYMYWNNSPDTGRNNFTTATSDADVTYDPDTGQTFLPGDSAPNHVDVNMMRLGVSGQAKFGNFFDVSAEVAAVPYAKVNGVVGIDDPSFNTDVYSGPAQVPYSGESGNISFMRASETTIDGVGYGAMAEAWLGMHPTENLVFRLGGRAWYLQGTADTTFSGTQITNPIDSDSDGTYDTAPTVTTADYIDTNSPFSLFRYGLMAELSYAF